MTEREETESRVVNNVFQQHVTEDGYVVFNVISLTISTAHDIILNSQLETEHLAIVMEELHHRLNACSLEKALDALDPDATGTITKMDFLKWFSINAEKVNQSNQSSSSSTPRIKKGKTGGKTLSSTMLQAKVERKKVETDVKMLSNRLSHLRAEESKAKRRIEETQKRSQEIQDAKARKVLIHQGRKDQETFLKEKVRKMTSSNIQYQAQFKAKRSEKCTTATKKKMNKVKDFKEEKMQRKQQIEDARIEMHRVLLAKKEHVKKEQEEAMKKRGREKARREQEQIVRAKKQLADEYRRKLEYEAKFRDMETEEARLIESLKKTQEMQQAAFDQLEDVI